MALLLAGCGEPKAGTPFQPITTTPPGNVSTAPVTKLQIRSFVAGPTSITSGQSSLLSWELNDPDATVTISPKVDPIDDGSVLVSPTSTTTYTLTATADGETVTATATVTVASTGSSSGDPVSSGDSDWVNVTGNLAGVASECGNLTMVSANPNSDMVIAGVAKAGLFALTGTATDWAPLGTAGSGKIVNRPSTIIYDPSNPNLWWESGIYGGPGGFQTDDNGASFRQLGNVLHSDAIAIDFSDPQRRTMLSATHERSEVAKSTDGGASWVDISPFLPTEIGNAGSPMVLSSSTYLLGTKFGNPARVLRTTDSGVTWTTVYDHGVVGTPIFDSTFAIYWLLENGAGLIKSTDLGEHWELVTEAAPTSSLIALPGDGLAGLDGNTIVTSKDGGVTWTPVGPPTPFEALGISYSAARQSFFAWHWDCGDFVLDDAIAELKLD